MRGRTLGALALLFPLTVPCAAAVFSPAARRMASAGTSVCYEGTRSTGVLLAEESCPIAVEKEVLTIDVRELPSPDGERGFAEYGATATARYTFRNPTENPHTATLWFPFGTAPDYAPDGFDFYGDTARYSVKKDGNAIAVNSRYSYCGDGALSVDNGPALIEDDTDGFFRADTPVTAYTFRVTPPPQAEGDTRAYFTLCLTLKVDPARTRIAASEPSKCFIDKGFAVVSYRFPRADGAFSFSLYAFGDGVTLKKQGVYDDRSALPVEGAAVEEIARTEDTFAAFAAEKYPGTACGMAEGDWYRGFSDALGAVQGGVMCSAVPDEIGAADFMRWYQYDLQFEAGEEIVNEVSAPIYPTVRENSAGLQYEYTYLLSPARKWASFGGLRVEILTDYDLTASSLDFERAPETGYVLEWADGLPLGELTFTLTEGTGLSGIQNYAPYERGLSAVEIALIVLLCVAVAAVGVTATIGILRRRRAAPPAGGGAEEGKVDLPDDKKGKK